MKDKLQCPQCGCPMEKGYVQIEDEKGNVVGWNYICTNCDYDEDIYNDD